MHYRYGVGVALLFAAGQVAAATFQDLGVPGGQGVTLSRNGRIAAGIAGESGWRWAKDRGVVALTGFTSAQHMNSWAQPIAGEYSASGAVADAVGALAFSNSDLVGGPLLLGGFPGGGAGSGSGVSTAYGVSDDGVAVGLAYDAANTPIAFRWTRADGMTRLAVNRPASASRANDVSADGHTVVGWNDQNDGSRTGVLWRDGAVLDLTDTSGSPVGEAHAATSDGSIVVGEGALAADGGSLAAWRWTAAGGVVALPQPTPPTSAPESVTWPHARAAHIGAKSERARSELGDGVDGGLPPSSFAFDVSEDGSVIVGRGGTFSAPYAAIWTAQGAQALADYAAAHGVTIPAGWTLISANAVSADGKTILGWGANGSALGTFLIDLHDAPAAQAQLVAHGTVDSNSLGSGPFAGVAAGTQVTMSFRLSQDGAVELEPGENTRYPIAIDTFQLTAGTASDVLVQTEFGPGVQLTNDYPLSDGIHLLSSPLSTEGQMLEFELFNPGGDLFDSDDLERIDRRFDPSFFEKAAWSVSQGDAIMTIVLDDVSIHDVVVPTDIIFANGFD